MFNDPNMTVSDRRIAIQNQKNQAFQRGASKEELEALDAQLSEATIFPRAGRYSEGALRSMGFDPTQARYLAADSSALSPRLVTPSVSVDAPNFDFSESAQSSAQMLPNAVAASASNAPVVTQARRVSSGGAVTSNAQSDEEALTSGRLLRRALESVRNPVDISALNELAKQRAQEGDTAMMNALAAQFAGERFQPVQAQYLKRSMEAQSPMKVGNYGVISGGRFVADPYAQRDLQADVDLRAANALMGSEDRRYNTAMDYAAAMARRGGTDVPAGIQMGDQRAVSKADEQAQAGSRAFDALNEMAEIMTRYKGSLIAPEIGFAQRTAAAFGSEEAAKKVQDYERLQQLAATVGIETLSQIGGNDTERELAVAISTAFDPRNLTESNLPLIRLKAAAAKAAIERPAEMSEWVARNGSLMRPDEKTGETWYQYWNRRQVGIKKEFGLKESGNLRPNNNQVSPQVDDLVRKYSGG